jgi:acylphosphatase
MMARSYRVTGRVQGVGYRYFARTAALRMGVRGWVRNRADGNVEVHAEAECVVLEAFRTELERGPSLAWVSEVKEEPANVGGCISFEIRG